MMIVFNLALFLTGITWSTGAPTFTQKPESTVYFKKGSNAVLKWGYSDTQGELNIIIWRVYNKTEKKLKPLILLNQTGHKQPNPNIPLAYIGRVETEGQATLVIKNITFEDSTDFTCSLTTKVAVADTNTVKLVVTGFASVHPPITFAEVGGSLTFTCNATSVPSQSFSWRRRGETKRIKNDAHHTITCSGTGSCDLVIKNIAVGHRGFYVCDVVNQTNSAAGYLQVLYPPKEDNVCCPVRNYEVKIGEQLSICCPVSGYPPPIVIWEKNGTLLQKKESMLLNITLVEDEENYLCTATDGKNSSGPFVIVVRKKGAELPVTSLAGTSSKAAKLEWTPQIGAKYYVVNITNVDDDDDNNDILDDISIGTQTSLEVNYHTLVMKKADKKPDKIAVCAKVYAMNDARLVGESPTCQKLTITKPTDTEN